VNKSDNWASAAKGTQLDINRYQFLREKFHFLELDSIPKILE